MRAGTDDLRVQNRAIVLRALRELGPVSHTEIAEWTGLSSASVSTITAELAEEKTLLRSDRKPAGGRGRPRSIFAMNPDCAFVAAVRITSTAVEYSLVDYCATLKDRFEERRPLDETDPVAFGLRFKTGLARLIGRARLREQDIRTISITSKGLVAEGKPDLLWSPVFEDNRIDFEALLRPDWTARILLTNETRFAAQALGSSGGPDSIFAKRAVLSLGHSIGLGISSHDALGKITSIALPFGHMVHVPDGPVCRCGEKGCIEAHAGFYGILRTAFEVPGDTIPAKFIPVTEIDKIAARARAGDRRAAYAFRLAGEALGIGLSRLYSLYGVMPLTITGPGLIFFDLLEDALRKHMAHNLQVRFGSLPAISFEVEETNLIFRGNVQASLSDLDESVIAKRATKENER